jgi:glycosyltransferase involved in cell wall biosynthesis
VTNKLKKQQVETEIVLMFGKYASEQLGWRGHWKQQWALGVLARGPWTRIHHILPYAVRRIARFSPSLARRVALAPDPIDAAPEIDRRQARRMLSISESARVISLVGLIERRKGVRELLEAMEIAAPRLRSDDCVLLAGHASEEVSGWLEHRFRGLVRQGRIVNLNRYLSQQELWAACIGADVVCTPYPQHVYSASIVIRAAAAGVPVLSNSIGWMDETIRHFSLGSTCDTNDREIFADAIVHGLNDAGRFRLNSRARNFVKFHTVANFSNHITERLSQRMGLPAASRFQWEDVDRPQASTQRDLIALEN